MSVIWPTGQTGEPYTTDRYGPRQVYTLPDGSTTSPFHHGVDIPKPLGFAWRAPFSGRVVYSGAWGGWGNTVVIEGTLGGRRVQAAITHNLAKGLAPPGPIEQGAIVAYCGRSGQALGYHTCFRLYADGSWSQNQGSVDPRSWIPGVGALSPKRPKREEEGMPKVIRRTGSYREWSLIWPPFIGTDPAKELGYITTTDEAVAGEWERSWADGYGSADRLGARSASEDNREAYLRQQQAARQQHAAWKRGMAAVIAAAGR